MRQRIRKTGSLPFARLTGACLIAGLTSACSGDSLRFADSPFSNPFASSSRLDPATTNSVATKGAPVQRVASSAIQAPRTPTYQPLPNNVGATGQPVSASHAAVVARNEPVLGSANGWSASGGTPVTVGQGDTVEALSGRYGIPVSALRATNGLSGNAQPQPGQNFVIPAFNPGGKAAAAAPAVASPPRAPTPAPFTAPARAPRYESLSSAPARPAAPQQTASVTKVQPQKVAAKPKAVAPAKEDDDEDEEDDKPAVKPVKPAKTAKAEPVKAEPSKPARAATKNDEPQTTASVSKAAEPAKDSPEFRWPARGRVISGYGSKSTNGSNDGINIALPEGTPIKATEGGTVAYAGEEIKGYGKMVLIRHPNGYVSAYAHNGDLNVKRGEAVKRGQVIAKSGQSGNVTSPQLHFELRKGADPVDPTKYLE